MAKIAPGPIELFAVGRISGVIAANRRGTPYVRRRYRPDTPSARQIVVRSTFTVVDTAWKNLSPTLKQAWRVYQAWRRNFGYNRFQKINIPRQLASLPLILDPGLIP